LSLFFHEGFLLRAGFGFSVGVIVRTGGVGWAGAVVFGAVTGSAGRGAASVVFDVRDGAGLSASL
jgi:hypothetical protein